MGHTIDLRILELLCSRICHDLISPVTAINNGMELLEDDRGDMLDDIRDLLKNSASEGSDKLQFYRLAYGLGGDPDGEIGIGTAAELSAKLAGHGKSSVVWPADRARMLPRLVVKAAMNMVLIAFEALPRGGEIVVRIDDAGVTVEARGTGARMQDTSRDALGDIGIDALTPRSIQTYFARQVVAAAGGCLSADAPQEDFVKLFAEIPA
ncbi:MAG: histidine phosphotransferase family protein [Rhodospirillaceae bacterium]